MVRCHVDDELHISGGGGAGAAGGGGGGGAGGGAGPPSVMVGVARDDVSFVTFLTRCARRDTPHWDVRHSLWVAGVLCEVACAQRVLCTSAVRPDMPELPRRRLRGDMGRRGGGGAREPGQEGRVQGEWHGMAYHSPPCLQGEAQPYCCWHAGVCVVGKSRAVACRYREVFVARRSIRGGSAATWTSGCSSVATEGKQGRQGARQGRQGQGSGPPCVVVGMGRGRCIVRHLRQKVRRATACVCWGGAPSHVAWEAVSGVGGGRDDGLPEGFVDQDQRQLTHSHAFQFTVSKHQRCGAGHRAYRGLR